MRNSGRLFIKITLLICLFVFIPSAYVFAGDWKTVDDSSWCDEKTFYFEKSVCEVREITINERWNDLIVEGSPNGVIEIEGWDKDSIFIQAKVEAKAGSKDESEDLMSEVELTADSGRIKAEGPRDTFSKKYWSVSYRIKAPVTTNLELDSVNGGVIVKNIQGEIEAKTVNGGIILKDVSGDVNARTVNGGIVAELDDKKWNRKEFEASTTNGGIKLVIPEDCSARLKASTNNGGINIDFPITIKGRIKKSVDTTLGDGGGDIDLRTINGGIIISKR